MSQGKNTKIDPFHHRLVFSCNSTTRTGLWSMVAAASRLVLIFLLLNFGKTVISQKCPRKIRRNPKKNQKTTISFSQFGIIDHDLTVFSPWHREISFKTFCCWKDPEESEVFSPPEHRIGRPLEQDGMIRTQRPRVVAATVLLMVQNTSWGW